MKTKPTKRFSTNDFKESTIQQLLTEYEVILHSIEEDEGNNAMNEAKNKREYAKKIARYIIKHHLKKAPIKNIRKWYNKTTDKEYSGEMLLLAFAEKASHTDDLLWAYNENVNEHEDIDDILRKKLKKTSHVTWWEILEDEKAGSRVCYLGIRQMIAKTKIIGDLICTLQANQTNIPNVQTKKNNQAELMQLLPTIRITREEAVELKDEFERKNGKITLKNWE